MFIDHENSELIRSDPDKYNGGTYCKFCKKLFANTEYMTYLQHTANEHGSPCCCCGRFFIPYEIRLGWSVLCHECVEWFKWCPPCSESLRKMQHSEFGYGDTRLPMHMGDPPTDLSQYRYDPYPTTHYPRNWTWNPETLKESIERIHEHVHILDNFKKNNSMRRRRRVRRK